MSILYLHGLDSTNQNERTEWLSKQDDLVNPLMQYCNYPLDYQYLEKLVIQHKPKAIVASSLGGYFAFHLGNYYNIPTILMNPALLLTRIVKPDNRALATQSQHFISLGLKDDVIPPFTTIAFLKENKVRYDLHTYDIGHETDFEVFLDICTRSNLFSI